MNAGSEIITSLDCRSGIHPLRVNRGNGARLEEGDSCYHGGAFFDAIGREFNHLDRISRVINADVLDAWFAPSPLVIESLSEHLEWVARTSPPTAGEGLTAQIALSRSAPQNSILAGAGPSHLTFLGLPRWLSLSSRVLITDPGYGEYAHVLENVVGCDVTRFELRREDNYAVDLKGLESTLAAGFDLVVLVNPNNPTGQHISRRNLEDLLSRAPASTLFWIDETYIDYVDEHESLEGFVFDRPNVVVFKAMSKTYALSSLQVGYLCANAAIVESLRRFTSPWAVSLPGQIAAVMAPQDPVYYQGRYGQTHVLRERLAADLVNLVGCEVVPGVANYLLCHLPGDGQDVETLLDGCRQHNLFLRDVSITARVLDSRTFRITVKDSETDHRMVEMIGRVLRASAIAEDVVG